MTNENSQVELIMMPPGYEDDESNQGELILPDDFNEEWKEILSIFVFSNR